MFLVSRTLGSAAPCHQCGRDRGRGSKMWDCASCNRRLCPTCKEARPHWRGVQPATQQGQSQSVHVVPPPQADEMTLLALLRKLPASLAVRTPDAVPKRARGRMGRLARSLLDDLMTAMSASAGDDILEEKALMLNHLYAAILRSERKDVQDATCNKDAAAEPATWKHIRSRMQLAEAGRWKQIYHELLQADVVERSARPEHDWVMETMRAEESASLHARKKLTAAGKVRGGCVRTGAQILKGDGLLTPSAATCDRVRELLTTEMTPREARDQQVALEEAWKAGEGNKVVITEGITRQRVGRLRTSAQPGGSRTRNDLINCLVDVPGGVASLRAWCQRWADGLMPKIVARVLTSQILRPLKKPNGMPRPIALLEVFLKFASGCIQDAIRMQPGGEGLDWNQYGGHPAGPELMLMVGQGMMNIKPGLAFISFDMKNAFGRAKRASMLRASARWCKQHCRFLCSLWSTTNTAWIEHERGQWTSVGVADGAFQGDTSSTPSFSRAMRLAITQIETAVQEQGIWMQALSLVDD
eukprot:12412977-Karenia_brevis.AAC.1